MTAQGTAQVSWSQLESEQRHDTLGWTGQEHSVHKGQKGQLQRKGLVFIGNELLFLSPLPSTA